MTDIDEVPEQTEAGSCDTCHDWTPAGRVIREIHSNSGPGAVVVRCASCVATPHRRPPKPPHTRTYPL